MSGSVAAPNAPASNRTGWVVMSALWMVDGTSTVMIFLIGVALPEIRNDFPIRPVQEGLLGAVFFIALTTLSLPSAIWMSRFSPRLVTLLALVGMTVAAAAQGFAPNYWVLLLARLLFMYALVSRTQAEVLLIQQWFSGPRIATLNSITVASFGLGQLAAIGLVPILMPMVGGWRGIHLLLAVVYAVVAIGWLIFGRERPYQYTPSETATTVRREGVFSGGPAGVLRRHPTLFILASTQFGGAMAWASFITFFPTFALDKHGLSLVQIGVIFSAFPIGATIGSLTVGLLSNMARRRKPFIFLPGFVMPVLYVTIMSLGPDSPLLSWLPSSILSTDSWALGLLPFLIMLGIMTASVVPIVLTVPYDMQLMPREVAVAVGLVRTITPLGSAIGPILSGVLTEFTGSLETALFIVLPVSISVGLIGLTLRETHPGRRSVDGQVAT